MLTTGLCGLLGIRVPIIQAPIAAAPHLAAAAANAGAFGMLGLSWTPVEDIAGLVAETRRASNGRFGVNLVVAEPQHERLEAALAADVPLVSLFWGDPAPYIESIHAAGALAACTVGSAGEARRAVDAGVDVVVAQGWEAGGHVWGTVATLALVPAVVDACAPVPVVAAGGIADGRALAAVLALGADGAWIGTRFVASAEGPFADHYKRRIVAASETETTRTTAFHVGWPNAPHRVLRTATVDAYEAGDRAEDVVAYSSGGEPIRRYSFWEPADGMRGDLDALALYAGQASGVIGDVRTVEEIVTAMVGEAESSLRRTLVQPDDMKARR